MFKKSFTIGFADANHEFGSPAENVNIPSSVQDTLDGCAFHSEATILNQFGVFVTEEQLRDEGKAEGWYQEGKGTPKEYMGRHLSNHGIPIKVTEGNGIDNLISETSQHHCVMVALDSGELWHHGIMEKLEDVFVGGLPDHAVLVDGLSIENNTITLTDSGTGNFRTEYPLNHFMNAWKDSNYAMVATTVSPEEYLAQDHDDSDFDCY